MRRSFSLSRNRLLNRLLAGGAIAWLGLLATSARAAADVPAAQTSEAQSVRTALNLKEFDRVWDLVNRKYYDAMLALLHDHHTQLWKAAKLRGVLKQKTVRTGIGLIALNNRLVVRQIVPGSPADLAGVKLGWVLLTINGKPRSDQFDPVEGSIARFGFLDARDQPVTIDMQERMIAVEPESRMLGGDALYLGFHLFDFTDLDWLYRQVRANRQKPAMVIDLRGNPGGKLSVSGAALGIFFEKAIDYGEVVTRAGRDSDIRTFHFLSPRYRGRLAVLVDEGTASAAEIFAAVMQEEHRAVIVGRPTAGSVLVSDFYSVPDGGKLQLSIEDYTLPGGRHLEGQGVKPDVALPLPSLADLRAGRDPDIDAAMDALDKPNQ
jgi:carboxyl-terminal processing protease